MGYTVYGRTAAMGGTEWETYVLWCRVAFRRLYADRGLVLSSADMESSPPERPFGTSLPLARKRDGRYEVVFNGATCDEQHEWFLVSSDTPDGSPLFVKTLRKPYDFAVKCAMVLLAEVGGLTGICDDDPLLDSYSSWFDVIGWLSEQPNLPSEYPTAMAMLHLCDEEGDEALVMRAALERHDRPLAAWALSASNPYPARWGKFRRMGLRIVERLRAVRDRRRLRATLWVPRLVEMLR